MFKDIIKEMFHPSKAAIISALKRSEGLPVTEIAKEVDMSYMGVKQHCINLEKLGFLENKKVARKDVGRPEKQYCLTDKCDDIFPDSGNELSIELLDASKEVFGEDAPENLLRKYFNKKEEEFSKKIKGSLSLKNKVRKLCDLLEEQGFFVSVLAPKTGDITLIEYHNPLYRIIKEYPIVRELQHDMMQNVLKYEVTLNSSKGRHGKPLTQYKLSLVA